MTIFCQIEQFVSIPCESQQQWRAVKCKKPLNNVPVVAYNNNNYFAGLSRVICSEFHLFKASSHLLKAVAVSNCMFLWRHDAHISVWDMRSVFVQIFPYVWEGQKNVLDWTISDWTDAVDDKLIFFSFIFQYFSGNRDRNTLVSHPFIPAIRGQYIRIHPWGWHAHISMRVEFYGCRIGKPL